MQAPRHLRFVTVAEVERLRPTIKAFIQEAIELERNGAKVPLKKSADIKVPEELQVRFEADASFEKAFTALTPSRQKGYILQISAARQSSTRTSRVEKYTPKILAGKGWND
jgi:uncharacterized protein YdeI (YjbR/CyaY-like superfamily)